MPKCLSPPITFDLNTAYAFCISNMIPLSSAAMSEDILILCVMGLLRPGLTTGGLGERRSSSELGELDEAEVGARARFLTGVLNRFSSFLENPHRAGCGARTCHRRALRCRDRRACE